MSSEDFNVVNCSSNRKYSRYCQFHIIGLWLEYVKVHFFYEKGPLYEDLIVGTYGRKEVAHRAPNKRWCSQVIGRKAGAQEVLALRDTDGSIRVLEGDKHATRQHWVVCRWTRSIEDPGGGSNFHHEQGTDL